MDPVAESRPTLRPVPRSLHPGAWWLWAMSLAVVAAHTTNPLLLGLVVGVAALVVAARREDAPWARAFGLYLRIGLLIVIIRVLTRVVLGGEYGTHVLVNLPELPLPDWLTGVRLGGSVTAESLLAATYDGLRLAAIVVCFGAANCLANPRRLLRLLPNALYEIGSAVAVAVSVAPQLAESIGRVRRARRLRGGSGGGARTLLMPVLEDALDRCLSLAAAMDARGFGRFGNERPMHRLLTTGLLVVGLMGICIGLYGMLDASAPFPIGLPGLAAGLALTACGVVGAGRRTRHSRYRPDLWLAAEWAVAAVGIAAAALTVTADPALLHPPTVPLGWPRLAVLPTIGLGVASLAAAIAPVPPLRASRESLRPARPPMGDASVMRP